MDTITEAPLEGGAGGSMDPPAFQTKVWLNTKVSALKPNESLKTEFGPPGIKFLTEPLVRDFAWSFTSSLTLALLLTLWKLLHKYFKDFSLISLNFHNFLLKFLKTSNWRRGVYCSLFF